MEPIDDREYIDERKTPLDAVEALAPHREAVILVGVQEICVHTAGENASFAIPPFTYVAPGHKTG